MLHRPQARLLLAALGLSALLATAAMASADQGRVVGTKHDVTSPGEPVCVVCHIPREPGAETYWADQPQADGPLAGLKALCFSCHDGTVAKADNLYVFDPARPNHPSSPGEPGQDCDRCHDAHRSGYGQFIKLPGGANICQGCHPRAGPADHPVNISAPAAGIYPADSHWDPQTGDFSGTRLWNAAGSGPGDLVMCLTCHNPHGGQPGTKMNTVELSGQHSSLLSLCQACHKVGGD